MKLMMDAAHGASFSARWIQEKLQGTHYECNKPILICRNEF